MLEASLEDGNIIERTKLTEKVRRFFVAEVWKYICIKGAVKSRKLCNMLFIIFLEL